MPKISQINTSEVISLINTPEIILVDVRPVEYYNGWNISQENRGGHIKGAKSLPFKWSNYFDWPDILVDKNITPFHHLILYGYNNEETLTVAFRLLSAGFKNISVYNNFLSEWSVNELYPMSRLFNFSHLVSASWLHDLLRDGTAPLYTNSRYVLGHTYYYDKSIYDNGHIPGAIPINTNDLESPQTWNRRSPEELKTALENLGIDHATTVILYGSFSSFKDDDPFPGRNAGHIAAMRCAFIMMYAGVKDVRILNGGMQAWIDEHYPVSITESPKMPIKNFGVSIPQHPELVVDLQEAKNILHSKNKNLVCVRSWNEYIGETSGYNYIKKKGRIPGAVFANCGSDAYHMEQYRNVDYTTREYHEIEKMWIDSGITPDKHNSFYCGTGWRASEAFMNAWLMGWPNVSVFDGGWFEWSNDESNPVEKGIPDTK